jgi:hypothetical protein
MKPKLLLGFALVLSGGLFVVFVIIRLFPIVHLLPPFPFGDEKADQRVESVQLPTGEVLENQTYYQSGFHEGGRYNKLFLKNPANGNSELVGDVDYEACKETPSLFFRFPHPLEFVRENEKVLVIGSTVCERVNLRKGFCWSIASFDTAEGFPGAMEYLKTFLKPDAMAHDAHGSILGGGPPLGVHYAYENLDFENNVLTVKRIWDAKVNFPEEQYKFPDYLVYSACGYNGGSGYGFPWKFDEARTRAKNGPRWEKSMPFKMALDYSVITFPAKVGFMAQEEKRDAALAHVGAKEIATTMLELSDKELQSAECKYAILTNTIVDKIVAMYGYACLQSNRFYIVWEPRNPEAWPASILNLNEWALVGEDGFEGNIFREEYIRLRKIEP